MTLRKLIVLSGAIVLLLTPAIAADSITLEIMASRTSWANKEFTGHAFLCIALNLQSGIKEDCYGFYPTGSGMTAAISGSGGLASEFTKNPTRFGRVDVSVKKGITSDQRRMVIDKITDWDKKNFELNDGNCIDFVNSVAETLGWKTPKRSSSQFPLDYVKELAKLNP